MAMNQLFSNADPQDLMEALNNPQSPQRMKLLGNLAMSPLDPAAAYQQMRSAPQQNGAPTPGGQMPGSPMADVINPVHTTPDGQQLPPAQMDPGVVPGSRGPWDMQYPEPPPEQTTPGGAMTQTPAADGGMVGSNTAAPSSFDLAGALKMLQGIAGGSGSTAPPPHVPYMPPVSGQPSRTVTMGALQGAPVTRQMSLAELLAGRG